MKPNYINALLVVVAGIVMVLGCGKSEEEARQDQVRKEGPGKMAAARKDFAQKPQKAELTQQPYLKGKAVMLYSLNGGEFGYQGSPAIDAIKASLPEEVGSVVLQECKSVQKGVYVTKESPPREIPAMALDCVVTIIDRTIPAVIHTRQFQGTPSEEARVSETSNSVTAGPTKEIDAFLAGLPKR